MALNFEPPRKDLKGSHWDCVCECRIPGVRLANIHLPELPQGSPTVCLASATEVHFSQVWTLQVKVSVGLLLLTFLLLACR